jgi:group I intron endonuclease
MGYIYKITNLINNQAYIGQTTQHDPNTRWKAHVRAVKYGNGCPVLSNAIKKYGAENFKFEVLIICFDTDVIRYEQSYISKYKTIVPNGYNVQEGGNVGGMFKGRHHTEESKKLLSERSIAYYNSPEVRKEHGQKVREGHLRSEIWKLAIAENRAFRKGLPTKVERSEDHRRKISESLKKWYATVDRDNKRYVNHSKIMTAINGKLVEQYTKDGSYLGEFPSIAEAARQTGLTRKNVQACVSGYTKTAGGFVWKYGLKSVDDS